MRVGVLYICTGIYTCFWKDFYASCEKYFLKDIADIEYFVFTDDLNLSYEPNVHLIKKEPLGFPLDSLLKFNLFLSIEERLKKFDYLYFFNSNMLFVDYVGKEILPPTDGIVDLTGLARCHPRFYMYERNKKSEAFIPYRRNKKYRYFQGGLQGGKVDDFLSFCKTCKGYMEKDLRNNFIPIFHDESYVNKYAFENTVHPLTPEFGYPEGWNLPYKPKIILRDKTKVHDYFIKQPKPVSIFDRIKRKINRYTRAYSWYFIR